MINSIETNFTLQDLSSEELIDIIGGGDIWKVAVGAAGVALGAYICYQSGGIFAGVGADIAMGGLGLIASNID